MSKSVETFIQEKILRYYKIMLIRIWNVYTFKNHTCSISKGNAQNWTCLNVYHHILIDVLKRENSCILVHSEVFLRPRKICYSLHLIECIMDNQENRWRILTCIRDISKLSNYMRAKKISVTLPAKRSTIFV